MTEPVFEWLAVHQPSCLEEDVSAVLCWRGAGACARSLLTARLVQPARASHSPGRIFLTQQVQAAGAASEDNAEGNPFAQGKLWKGLGFWLLSKYVTRGRFSALLAFHRCSSSSGSQKIIACSPLHHGWKGKAVSVHVSQDLMILQKLISNVNFLCDPFFPGKYDLWFFSSYVGSFWVLEAISCYAHLQDHMYMNSSTAETVGGFWSELFLQIFSNLLKRRKCVFPTEDMRNGFVWKTFVFFATGLTSDGYISTW